MFTEEERLRGLSYLGGGARMRAFARRLLDGQPIKAVFLGGSITAGSGAGDVPFTFVSRFAQYLNASFPLRCVGGWAWGGVRGGAGGLGRVGQPRGQPSSSVAGGAVLRMRPLHCHCQLPPSPALPPLPPPHMLAPAATRW